MNNKAKRNDSNPPAQSWEDCLTGEIEIRPKALQRTIITDTLA